MENEDVMRINDVKRRSFNKGWKAAVKKAEKWLSKHAKEYICVICDSNITSVTYEDENLIKNFRKAMEE